MQGGTRIDAVKAKIFTNFKRQIYPDIEGIRFPLLINTQFSLEAVELKGRYLDERIKEKIILTEIGQGMNQQRNKLHAVIVRSQNADKIGSNGRIGYCGL